jgi:hypothetical protein
MISVSKPTVLDVTTLRGRERAREIWTDVQVTGLSVEDLEAAKRAGYEPGEGSERFVGRDPREMSRDEIEAMGHEAMSATEAIRAKCLDCCAGSAHEVRSCVAMDCRSWRWRMGTNPWRQPMSDEQREVRRQAALRRGLGARRPSAALPSGGESPSGVPG